MDRVLLGLARTSLIGKWIEFDRWIAFCCAGWIEFYLSFIHTHTGATGGARTGAHPETRVA